MCFGGGGSNLFSLPKSFEDFQRRIDPLGGGRTLKENLSNPGKAIGETFSGERIKSQFLRGGLGGGTQAAFMRTPEEIAKVAEEDARKAAEAAAEEQARLQRQAEQEKQAFLSKLRGRRRTSRLEESGVLGRKGLLGR